MQALEKVISMYTLEMEQNVERIDYNQTSLEDFKEKVEKRAKPIIITNSLTDFENQFNFSFKVGKLKIEPL